MLNEKTVILNTNAFYFKNLVYFWQVKLLKLSFTRCYNVFKIITRYYINSLSLRKTNSEKYLWWSLFRFTEKI